MKRKTAIFALLVAALFVVTLSFTAMATGEKEGKSATLTGEISDDGLLITDDGQEFELAGEIADEVKQLAGERIQVMGTVMEEGGKQKVEVENYMIKEMSQEKY